MSLYGRLSARFLIQVGAMLLAIWCVAGGVLVWRALAQRSPGPVGPNPTAILQGMPGATKVLNGTITVSNVALSDVQRVGGWLQILDEDGNVVYRFRTPAGVPAKYPPGLLVYDRQDPQAFGYQLATWYGTVDGRSLTWLFGFPLGGAAAVGHPAPYVFVLCGLTGSLLVALLGAGLFGRRLGRPLLHMLHWLHDIAQGSYAEPADRRGVPRSRTAAGGLRRPYRLYVEVLSALDRLASSLRHADLDRQRLQQAREEWIAGVTHDLRTPLSTVKGYADMCAAPSYAWSEQEVRQFGRLISEKAAHMDGLIDDLELTFRLRSHALPLHPAPSDIVAIARAVVTGAASAPTSKARTVTLKTAGVAIIHPVDAQWFTRALANLVGNARLHNPPGTTITVTVAALPARSRRYPGVRVTIRDDGAGMDEETMHHLFERYYRGTDTHDARATGSGLGMAIARQLVEAHGGRVTVESAPGDGTTVNVELPPQD